MKILVTGANGQLGSSILGWATGCTYSDLDIEFKTKQDLDITDQYSLETLFTLKNYDAVINAAAYTNVDGAETSRDLAELVNGKALVSLSKACNKIGALLVHVSTDYVFPGNSCVAYKETDKPEPINHYGVTKWLGEEAIKSYCDHAIIIRTSWLFDHQGNNFVKKILKLAHKKHKSKDKEPLRIISDQIGAPTYASDLAKFILNSLRNRSFKRKGVDFLNFTNTGIASWYDLAVTTVDEFNLNQVGYIRQNIECEIVPIKTVDYPTPAKRPSFSLLDLGKLQKDFGVVPQHWSRAVWDVTQFGFDSLVD